MKERFELPVVEVTEFVNDFVTLSGDDGGFGGGDDEF